MRQLDLPNERIALCRPALRMPAVLEGHRRCAAMATAKWALERPPPLGKAPTAMSSYPFEFGVGTPGGSQACPHEHLAWLPPGSAALTAYRAHCVESGVIKPENAPASSGTELGLVVPRLAPGSSAHVAMEAGRALESIFKISSVAFTDTAAELAAAALGLPLEERHLAFLT